jgi:two-component system, OmpR family, alkaline phosphatase synthesis response regulator PhoP
MSKRILVVEDARDLAVVLQDRFQREGYEVLIAADGESGIRAVDAGLCDIVLLDIMLPGINGFEVCREVRSRNSQIPVLMLTARNETVDKIVGLRLGADDYVTKPFDLGELVARVEALLRRATRHAPINTLCKFGEVTVDLAGAQVRRGGDPVDLTAREFLLLRCLIENRGVVLSRSTLMKEVWNYDAKLTTRTLDVHIAYLRQKLEEEPSQPRYIITIRGLGYKFVA